MAARNPIHSPMALLRSVQPKSRLEGAVLQAAAGATVTVWVQNYERLNHAGWTAIGHIMDRAEKLGVDYETAERAVHAVREVLHATGHANPEANPSEGLSTWHASVPTSKLRRDAGSGTEEVWGASR